MKNDETVFQKYKKIPFQKTMRLSLPHSSNYDNNMKTVEINA